MKREKEKCDLGIKPIYQYDLPGGGAACGYCAVSAIYEYYGLDPEKLNVETLLGTQNSLPYNFPGRDMIESYMGERGFGLEGTWPFDVLAVLHWHGFDTELVSKHEDGLADLIKSHIYEGHPILVLGWDFIHWIVISGFDGRKLIITDSTSGKNYKQSFDSFIEDDCNGLIFVSRKKGARIRRMTNAEFAKQYARGTKFCLQMAESKIKDLLSFGKGGGTWVGNGINSLFGYEEGTIVGNWINRCLG